MGARTPLQMRMRAQSPSPPPCDTGGGGGGHSDVSGILQCNFTGVS